MDFSKIKKIFYIIAIISMLLSIKSKVLGVSDITLNSVIRSGATSKTDTYSANLPSFLNDKYWVIRQVYLNTGYDTLLFYSDSPFTLTTNSSTGRFDHNVYMYNLSYGGVADTYTYTFTNGQTTNIISSVQLSDSWVNASSFKWTYGNFEFYINGQPATIINYMPKFIYPNFDNITEIENGYPDGVFVSRGSYSEDDYLYFHLLKITNTVSDGTQSTYYYEDKLFKLRKDTKYYRTYPADTEHEHSYYYITRSQLTLDTNSSYLYVLSNSSEKIDSSYGILQPDEPAGIYDVIDSDTAGVISQQDAINDKMANINETQQEVANNSNNINNFLNENTVSNDTNGNIDTSLNFNNSAPQFNSLFNGYFSRLTSIISDLGNYQDTDVITISIPIPFTNNTIPISSDLIFSNQNNTFLKNLSATLWYFIFGRYFLYFLINIYWLIANGQFFDYYLTQKEVITDDML